MFRSTTIAARVSLRNPCKSMSKSVFLRNMSSSSKPAWATVDPATMGVDAEPYAVSNLVGGKWTTAKNTMTIPHPLDKNAKPIFTIPDTQVNELGPFLESLRKVSKSGVHNPLKNPERYVQYGDICRKVRSKDRINHFRSFTGCT